MGAWGGLSLVSFRMGALGGLYLDLQQNGGLHQPLSQHGVLT